MSLLAPLFLAGAALILFPIIFHLIKRTPKDRRYFSSLLFLSPSPPRVTKKSRLDNLLLLALRCLAICLLAIAFTRPFFNKATALPPATGQKNVVLLVDASASMQQEGIWASLLQQAEAELRKAGKTDRTIAYLFDRSLTPVLAPEELATLAAGTGPQTILARLKEVKPGWGSTHLGASIISAVELLHDPKVADASYELVIISDFQDGVKLDGLQGYEWPKGWQIRMKPVRGKVANNAGIGMLSGAKGNQLKVRVVNAAGSKTDHFKLLSPGAPQETPLDLYVPAGQSRTVTVPTNFVRGPLVSLAIRGDGNEFDNELRWVPPAPRQIVIAHVGEGEMSDPEQAGYYLERAFQTIDRSSFVVTNYSTPEQLNSGKEDFAVFTAKLTPAWAEGLRGAAGKGKVVLIALAEGSEGVGTLFGEAEIEIREVKREKYGMFGFIDFQHPLFSPFNDPRFSDFTKISIWKNRQLEGLPEDVKVLSSFDNKDPAILEAAVGNGKLLVLTTTWKPVDSQLALSSKFVPLLYSALSLNGGLQQSEANWVVGDLVPWVKDAASVQLPDGTILSAEAKSGEFFRATLPGIYTFLPRQAKVAVNLSPDESRTTPMQMDEFKRLSLPLAASANATEVKTAGVAGSLELENKQKLWRWILLAVVLVLLLETIVAGKLSRQAAKGS